MGTISHFSEILSWQKARELNARVFEFGKRDGFGPDTDLRDQAQRASNSVVLNIAEGFGRRGRREFRNFLSIAHGSIAELEACMILISDRSMSSSAEAKELANACGDVSRLIAGLMRYLSSPRVLSTKVPPNARP
jgi:four helix bundle protein